MIDSVTLVSQDLNILSLIKSNSSNYTNCGDRPYCYRIGNSHTEENSHSLIVEFKRSIFSGERIEISGSFRKWYLGAMSDMDLRPYDFCNALSLLATCLKIDVNELYKFEIKSIEVGLNLTMQMDITTLKGMLIGYRNNYYERCEYSYSCNYSISKYCSSIIVYDKAKEIIDKFKKIKSRAQIDFLIKYKDLNLLRIEVKEKESKNIFNRLNILNIGQIANDYKVLLRFFFKCLNEVVLRDYSAPQFQPKYGTLAELSTYCYEKTIMQCSAFELETIACKLNPNSRKAMRSKNRKLYKENILVNGNAAKFINNARRSCVELYVSKPTNIVI